MRQGMPALLYLLLACGGEDVTGPVPPPPPSGPLVVSVTPYEAELAVGDSLQMSASVLNPADWQTVRIEWDTSDPAAASVSATGMAVALRNGDVGVRALLYKADGAVAQGVGTLHIK